MDQVLGVAEKIGTPLSLAALTVLVLYSLFKTIFEKLNLQAVVGDQVYQILMRAMTFIFILAIAGLVLGLASFLTTKLVTTSRLDKLLIELASTSSTTRASSINALASLAINGLEGQRVCDALAHTVRNSSTNNLGDITEESQIAVKAISDIIKSDQCSNVNLQGSALGRLQLPKGSLKSANLTNASLDDANLATSELSGARLIGAKLRETVMREAILIGADFREAVFERTDLRKANLKAAKGLAGADFWAYLEAAKLDETDLRRVNFRQTSLKGTSFSKADLSGADLSRTSGLCKYALSNATTEQLKAPHYEC